MKWKIMAILLLAAFVLLPVSDSDADTSMGGEGHAEGIDVIYSSEGPDGLGILYITLENPPSKSLQLILTSVSEERGPWLVQPDSEIQLALRPLEQGTYTMILAYTDAAGIFVQCQLVVGSNGTVSFDAAGGDGVMSPVTAELGLQYTLPKCDFGSPRGMHFAGWSVNTQKGEILQPGAEIRVGGAVVATAVWEDDIYSISYSPGEGVGETFSVTAKYGDLTLPDCPFAAPENKVFAGWAVDGETWGAGEICTITGDTAFVAQWEEKAGFPWMIVAIVLVILIALIIGLFLYRRERQ